jgi:hypothetical protein
VRPRPTAVTGLPRIDGAIRVAKSRLNLQDGDASVAKFGTGVITVTTVSPLGPEAILAYG